VYVTIGIGVLLVLARAIDVLALGEDTAAGMGVDVARVALGVYVAGALLAAGTVAAAGLVGFVGLLVPHLVRMAGARTHRTIIAAAALAAPTAPQPRVKNTKGHIEWLAMDGPLLAYDVKGTRPDYCNKLFVWNVQTGGGALVSGRDTCEADDSSTGGGVVEVAVAGKRVAWIVNQGGNT
ncbi:MAG: iron chelate uptake ABC transporter family permease subunit, partial [Pyrinomonadaceae bacterium]